MDIRDHKVRVKKEKGEIPYLSISRRHYLEALRRQHLLDDTDQFFVVIDDQYLRTSTPLSSEDHSDAPFHSKLDTKGGKIA